MPDGYLARPELDPVASFYWQAFTDLAGDRPLGMVAGPIPFLACERYAARYGIDDIDEFERFCAVIRALDAEYLRSAAKEKDES